MNLSELNTPADLVAANAAVPHTAESLYDLAVEHLDMTGAYSLAYSIVNQLACFHQARRNELVDANDPSAAAWAKDEGLLHAALMALGQLDMGQDNDEEQAVG